MKARAVFSLFALLIFEVFNYLSTNYALADILGGLSIVGIQLAALLAIAFCVIDCTFLVRIFGSKPISEEPSSIWYLFGAWFLAAAFNATLTWWGTAIFFMALGIAIPPFLPVTFAAIVLVVRLALVANILMSSEK